MSPPPRPWLARAVRMLLVAGFVVVVGPGLVGGAPAVRVEQVGSAPYAVDLVLRLPGEARSLTGVSGPGLAVSVTGGLPTGLPPRQVRVRVAVPSCARLPAGLDPAVRSGRSGGLLSVGVRDAGGRLHRLGLHGAAAARAAVRRLAAQVCPPGSYRLPTG